MQQFLRETGIEMRRPVIVNDNRPLWLCSFTRPGTERILEVFTSPTADRDREPTAVEAFQAAVNRAAEVDHASSFQDWASAHGHDPSPTSENLFRIRRAARCQLKGFLGPTLFASAMLHAGE